MSAIGRSEKTIESREIYLCAFNLYLQRFDLSFNDLPLDCVCDLGYGIAPGTVIDEGTLPIPDYHVLWPGKPTTNTVWTAVEGCTWFEAFSEEWCATGISCMPATHMQDTRKER